MEGSTYSENFLGGETIKDLVSFCLSSTRRSGRYSLKKWHLQVVGYHNHIRIGILGLNFDGLRSRLFFGGGLSHGNKPGSAHGRFYVLY